MFQFQIGAIGSSADQPHSPVLCEFQFQIGAIGRYDRVTEDRHPSSFNSRLVRLVGQLSTTVLLKLVEFQFQIGAIGSRDQPFTVFIDERFNSRLVRLVAVRRLKKIS